MAAHSSELRRMIALQGGAIRQVAAIDLSPHAARLAAAGRVLLVGTGTSLHAAQLGALMLQEAGLDARAIAALTMAQSPPAPRRDDLVIVISHTGETAYALSVRRALIDAGRPLLSIAGPKAGWEEAIMVPVAETSDTYTVSYTSALAVLALLAGAAGAPGLGADELAAVAARVDAIVADAAAADPLAPPQRAIAIVGPGAWGITAREGALKIREASHMLSEGFDCEQLLHGYAVPYCAGDTLLALQPGDDPDGLTAAMMEAAAAAGMEVTALVEEPLACSRLLAQIPMTVRLQLVAAAFAEQRGQDPDHVITGRWNDAELWNAGAP